MWTTCVCCFVISSIHQSHIGVNFNITCFLYYISAAEHTDYDTHIKLLFYIPIKDEDSMFKNG